MTLLDPSEIKDEKKQRELESQRRITALGAEEAAANKRVNDLLERERQEKERIALEAGPGLGIAKSILQTEVEALEVRKAEALRPVTEVLAEAEAKRIENNQQGELIAQKSAQLDHDRELLLDQAEKVKDQEQENTRIKIKLDSRDKKITEAEGELKKSAIDLGEKWVEFHKAVSDNEKNLVDRETKIASDAKANEVRAAELEKVAEQQASEHLTIADKYKTLQSAIAEFERKKTNG